MPDGTVDWLTVDWLTVDVDVAPRKVKKSKAFNDVTAKLYVSKLLSKEFS